MNLSPLDIRKQDFEKSLRGYSPDEVQAFLDMVATQWEEMQEKHRRLENKVQELENQMDHYKRVEEALQEALDQTRQNAEEKLENAKQEAKNIVQEARTEAQEIKQRAQARRDQLEAEAQTIQNRRSEVVARLRAFLHSELEILEEYQESDPEGGSDPPTARTEAAREEPEIQPLDEPGAGDADPEPDTAEIESAAADVAEEEATAEADPSSGPASQPEADGEAEEDDEESETPSDAPASALADGGSPAGEESEEQAEEEFAEEFAGLQESLSDVLDEEDAEEGPEAAGDDPDEMDSDIFEADTLPDVGELGEETTGEAPDAGETPAEETSGMDAETETTDPQDEEAPAKPDPVTEAGSPPSADAVPPEEAEDDDDGSGSYRSFEDIREEVTDEEPPSTDNGEETKDAPDNFSSTFDDIDTGEMDFSSAFEESADPDADEPMGSAATEVSTGGPTPSGDEEDDLERAMRSLFPVLPDEPEAEASEDEETGSADAAGDTLADEDRGDPSPTGSQFDAIKEDLQQQNTDEEDEEKKDKQKRSRSSDEEEASTEEIEKIWSILEDME